LRICYTGWGDYPHVRRFARWFSDRGHEVHVITHHPVPMSGVVMHDLTAGSGARSRVDRYAHFEFRARYAAVATAVGRVRRLVREIRPDVVHVQSMYYPGYLGAFVSMVPRVITVWAFDDVWLPLAKGPWLLRQGLSRWALERGRVVTGISTSLVGEILRLRVAQERVCVFHWGVDLAVFNRDKSRESVRASLGLDADGRKVVLSSRNLDATCNTELIVRAIPEVVKRAPNTDFLFLWNYEDRAYSGKIRKIVDELGIGRWTRFVGPIDYSQVHRYYRAADLFVSVPRFDSGPVSLIEAMACGAAPIVSDLACVSEWIDHGRNGLVVGPDDHVGLAEAIGDLLADDDRREKMAERNVGMVQQCADQDCNMEWMEDVYRKVIAGEVRMPTRPRAMKAAKHG